MTASPAGRRGKSDFFGCSDGAAAGATSPATSLGAARWGTRGNGLAGLEGAMTGNGGATLGPLATVAGGGNGDDDPGVGGSGGKGAGDFVAGAGSSAGFGFSLNFPGSAAASTGEGGWGAGCGSALGAATAGSASAGAGASRGLSRIFSDPLEAGATPDEPSPGGATGATAPVGVSPSSVFSRGLSRKAGVGWSSLISATEQLFPKPRNQKDSLAVPRAVPHVSRPSCS